MFSSKHHHLRCRIIPLSSKHLIEMSNYSFQYIEAPHRDVIHFVIEAPHRDVIHCVIIEAPHRDVALFISLFIYIYIYIYIYSEISYSFFKSSQYMSSQVKSSQVKSSQFKSIQVNHFSEAPSSWDVHIHMSLEAPLVGMSVYEYTFLGSTSRDVRVFFFISFPFLFSWDVVFYEPSPSSSHVCGILSVVNIFVLLSW